MACFKDSVACVGAVWFGGSMAADAYFPAAADLLKAEVRWGLNRLSITPEFTPGVILRVTSPIVDGHSLARL